MSKQVYINDQLIELQDESRIGLTLKAMSIFDINFREGSLTNKFNAPKTRANTEKLENLSNINSNTNIPYQENTGKLIQNGRQLISNGFAIVESSVGKFYKIVIYSGNTNFFDFIKGRNLNELDWSSSIHVYDIPTIIASFSQTTDFIYPIIDWGKGTSTQPEELLDNSTLQFADALIPCAFISDVLEKIAIFAGFELKGSFLDSPEYPRLILTPNQYGFSQQDIDDNNAAAFNVVPTGQVDTTIDSLGTATGPSEFVNIPTVFTAFSKPTFFGVSFVPASPIYGVLGFDFRVFINANPLGNTVTFRATINEDGVPIATDIFTSTANFSPTLNRSFSTVIVFLDPARVYTVSIDVECERDNAFDYNFRYELFDSSFFLSMVKNIPFTATMPFGTFFDQEQDKIFKDIVKQYCLIVQTNNITKQVFMNPLDDLQKNKSIARDWSDKIDLSKTITVKYRAGNYGQLNYMNYQEDDDVAANTGRGSFNIDDVNLPEVKNVVQLVSAGVERGVRVGGRDTPTIPLSLSFTAPFDKQKSRILLLDREDMVLDFHTHINNDTGQATQDVAFCYFQKDGRVDSLDFPNLIQANYGTLLGILNKVKDVTASFVLTEEDAIDFDFSIPVFLDVHHEQENINGYFYVNVIRNFKEASSIICNLIRL